MENISSAKSNKKVESHSSWDYVKFIIPSLIGIVLFMIPIKSDGEITIPIAFFAGLINEQMGNLVPTISTYLIVISVIGSIIAVLAKPRFITSSPYFNNLLNVSRFWLIARIVGMITAISTLYSIGPEWIHSGDTGGTLLFDLVPLLFSVFLLAGLFLPLLLNFGLLELFGALLVKVMRPVFKLPGRSSMDCIASWIGDGTIGVLLTTKQYEEGYYTKREAAVIATTFSVVSITFTIVINQYLELQEYFLQYYLTIILAGFVAAIIMPRIPPLSKKPDTGYEHTELKEEDAIPAGTSSFKWGVHQAVVKAKTNEKVSSLLKQGIQNVLDMWLGVLPIVMTIGTIALIIATYTPVFTFIGKPFEPILLLLQVPEAAEAAQTMVVGFADMFLPAVIGSGIESDMTRFIIGCVSVTQLVYMSELGGLLLGSKLPLNIFDLIIIFLLRTIITLPIVVLVAHLIF